MPSPNPSSQTIADLVVAIEAIAPPTLAEPWDNVGLLIGTPDRPLTGPVLLTIDLSEPVAEEARRINCSAVIAYHPPIFAPLKRLSGQTSAQRVVMSMLEAGIAVYSPHTALDACEGGLTDWLADGLLALDAHGIASRPSHQPGTHTGADRRALRSATSLPPTEQVKIVTFAPAEHVEKIRAALATAGAGLIGNYELCSFAVPGRGSFLGKEGSNPTVGQPGSLELVHENRLEMVCSSRALPLAVEMLRRFHPYEEPPIDIYALQPRPSRSIGAGRRIALDHPLTLEQLARRLRSHLAGPKTTGAKPDTSALDRILIAPAERPGSFDPAQAARSITVERLAVVPGSGGDLAEAARADGCEVFITGEMKHHEIRACVSSGLSVILAGHTQTERGYLPILAARLSATLPNVNFSLSEADRPPAVVCSA
ncbi:MAG: Nif3-like dinuclear metal center hexameric protein [Phycisphaeraceae bacterium]|nr:Nif3-like dinuclear metal center hexameric protein [Phycisphaeraceae bacterium]